MPRCRPASERRYEPRNARGSVLHGIITAELETLLVQARDDNGAGLPAYVERELRAVVSCGEPAAGFLRMKCDRCGHELLCPFSCGSRTACPSCASRRMESMTAHLCDRVIPRVPLRQWTVSFPFALRRLLAADAGLLSAVHRSFVRLVFVTLRGSAPVAHGKPGAISLLQRFDSSLGLDPHVHLVCTDGVFTVGDDGRAHFHDADAPSAEIVETVAVHLHASIRRILQRRGLITREGELVPQEDEEPTPLQRLYEAAARDFISSGTLADDGSARLRHRGPGLPVRARPASRRSRRRQRPRRRAQRGQRRRPSVRQRFAGPSARPAAAEMLNGR